MNNMKLKSILVATCMLIAGAIYAQDNSARLTFRVGTGIPGAGVQYFVQGLNNYNYGLSAVYSDYYSDTKTTPAICAEGYYICNEWLRAGLDLAYTKYSNECFDGISGQLKKERKGQSLAVLPTAMVFYYQKDFIRLYTSLGMGLGYYSGFDNMTGNLAFEVQFIPIGIEVGNRVFGFAEGGMGTAVSWVRCGVGFKF